MAKKKKEEKSKIILERTYNVPLRKGYMKTPRWKRTKKAVSVFREFIAKHMKSNDVKIGEWLNLELWKHGIKNPPHHVKVIAKKDEKGIVNVELAQLPKKAILEKEKTDKKAKELAEKKKKEEKEKKEEKKAEEKKTEEKKTEEKKEGKTEEKKEETKEEETEIEIEDALGGEDKKEEEKKKVEKEELKELKKEKPKEKPPKPAAMPKQVQQRPTAPMKK